MSRINQLVVAVVALLLATSPLQAAEGESERQSLEELRNTVVNLLQALVDKGLLTRDQAAGLVKQAQDKAAADVAAEAARSAATEKAEANAVRVPYVPQIVKDEISKQVADQVQPAVVASVVKEAKEEKWGVPGALPEWLTRMRLFGDVTLRAQTDMYASDNGLILDFNSINQAGGIGKVADPFLDTTSDRERLRLRARLGVEADITPTITAYIRLSSGSLTDPGSESQTLGSYGARDPVAFDQAYILWNSSPVGTLATWTAEGGRMPNPWFSPTELVYARDLGFDGVASTMRLGWGEGGSDQSHFFATAGAFPLLEVPLQESGNKWLLGAQLGSYLRWDDGNQRLRLGAAYYDFLHITGEKNAPDSTLLNYTAPAFIRYGNTVYDISNSTTDPTVNLFALAAHFRIADLAATYQLGFHRYSLGLTGEAVRNIGFNVDQVEALTGQPLTGSHDKGYVGEISFGDPAVAAFNQWRAALGYRYVQTDAVLDAWTDADFHEGGTNTEGYYLWAQYGVAKNTWLRLRYMSGNEISGPPRYGLDLVQFDVNTRF